MKKKTIKFIYFDLGGVVIDYIFSFKLIAEELSIIDNDLIDLFKKYEDELNRGTISWDQFESLLYGSLKTKKKLNKKLKEVFVSNFRNIEETHQFINKVHKNIKVGILSNVSLDIFQLVKNNKKIPNINYDSIIISEELKLIKPEKEIFDIALLNTKLKPHEVLFIDDSIININAAKSLGWQTVLFKTDFPQESIDKIKSTLL